MRLVERENAKKPSGGEIDALEKVMKKIMGFQGVIKDKSMIIAENSKRGMTSRASCHGIC